MNSHRKGCHFPPKNLNNEGVSSGVVPSAHPGLLLGVRQMSLRQPRTQAPKAKPQSPVLRNYLIPTQERFRWFLFSHKVFSSSFKCINLDTQESSEQITEARSTKPQCLWGRGSGGWLIDALFRLTCLPHLLSF